MTNNFMKKECSFPQTVQVRKQHVINCFLKYNNQKLNWLVSRKTRLVFISTLVNIDSLSTRSIEDCTANNLSCLNISLHAPRNATAFTSTQTCTRLCNTPGKALSTYGLEKFLGIRLSNLVLQLVHDLLIRRCWRRSRWWRREGIHPSVCVFSSPSRLLHSYRALMNPFPSLKDDSGRCSPMPIVLTASSGYI